MMKSPDEIKKGLPLYTPEEIKEILQQKWTIHSHEKLYRSALALIQQLEAERDALSEELKSAHSCFACKKFRRNGGECCGGSVCMMRDFEWRGVQKEG